MSKRAVMFNELTNGLLMPIVEMGLDWCKVIEVESGWVSDNYLAFARLMKWYYHPLTVLQSDADYNEPKNPVSQWKRSQCIEWLNHHDKEIDGKIVELKEKIMYYYRY